LCLPVALALALASLLSVTALSRGLNWLLLIWSSETCGQCVQADDQQAVLHSATREQRYKLTLRGELGQPWQETAAGILCALVCGHPLQSMRPFAGAQRRSLTTDAILFRHASLCCVQHAQKPVCYRK
jgi:hypothetical protein